MERRSFVRNAALVGAGILGASPLLASRPSVNLSELSPAERTLVSDYHRMIRKSTALSEGQATQLLGLTAILKRDNHGLLARTAAGQTIQLKRRGDRTVAQFIHQ
ncbi:hypothetical protein [Lewinella sp. W8]|uniref:hypothetical protein n=1 Tax=Lewinella sp. W8 TaxID=2528208 RepID=UPI001067B477|nr:hypothetical protein [Lewinella sp. W8]MTB53234.1 hypothetical protein [Lewinella sp. W8]